MTYKGKPQSPKDKKVLDNFQSRLDASSEFWQGLAKAISAHQIENLQKPRPLPVRKPQSKVINLIEKLKEAFYQQSVQAHAGEGRPTSPKVTFITPDLAILEIEETPDLNVEGCAPPDTMSESDKFDDQKGC